MSLAELTPTQRELQQQHIERRLRISLHAVTDNPINLKFKNGIDPSKVVKIPIKTVDESTENYNALKINTLELKVASLEAQLREVIHRLNTAKFLVPEFSDTPEEPPVRYPSISEIQKIICIRYRVTRNDICSRRLARSLTVMTKTLADLSYALCRARSTASGSLSIIVSKARAGPSGAR